MNEKFETLTVDYHSQALMIMPIHLLQTGPTIIRERNLTRNLGNRKPSRIAAILSYFGNKTERKLTKSFFLVFQEVSTYLSVEDRRQLGSQFVEKNSQQSDVISTNECELFSSIPQLSNEKR